MSLKAAASQAGVIIGTAVNHNYLSDQSYINFINANFDKATFENATKAKIVWQAMSTYNWVAMNNTVNALDPYMDYTVHAPLWAYHVSPTETALPDWLVTYLSTATREQAKTLIENYYTEIAAHAPATTYSIDPINELVRDPDGSGILLRDNPLKTAIGPDYVNIAYSKVKQLMPGVKTVINDYSVHFPGEKANSFFMLINDLVTQHGVPIDIIGVQGHLKLYDQHTMWTILETLHQLDTLGLEIAITEFDIRLDEGSYPHTFSDYNKQANLAYLFVQELRKLNNFTELTLWGTHDQYSWRPNQSPCLIDSNGILKPMYTAIKEALKA